MKKKISIAFIISLLVLIPASRILAQDDDRERKRVREHEEEMLEKRDMIREEHREQFEERMEQVRHDLEERRGEVRQRIETKREEFQLRAMEIRDENKRAAILRIDEHMDVLNQRLVNRFSEALDRLDSVLLRIVSRTEKASDAGLDVSQIEEKIQTVQANLDSARDAVADQAAKTYVIEITDEENLRADVSATKQLLRDDLNDLKDSIKEVADSIRDVLSELKSLPNIDDLEVNDGE